MSHRRCLQVPIFPFFPSQGALNYGTRCDLCRRNPWPHARLEPVSPHDFRSPSDADRMSGALSGVQKTDARRREKRSAGVQTGHDS